MSKNKILVMKTVYFYQQVAIILQWRCFRMIAFIKNYSLENIKNKLLILYILNVTDIISTLLLVGTGFYMEANTLMIKAVQSPTESIALKVVLPAVLLICIYFRMQKASDQQLKKANFFISGTTAIYALINISHLVWFACYWLLIPSSAVLAYANH
jgi:hypothetical protein